MIPLLSEAVTSYTNKASNTQSMERVERKANQRHNAGKLRETDRDRERQSQREGGEDSDGTDYFRFLKSVAFYLILFQ